MSKSQMILSELVTDQTKEVLDRLINDSKIIKGLEFLKQDNDNTTLEQIAMTEIPAPTFQEQERGLEYQKRLIEYGLKNVEIDRQGNVFGIWPGKGNGPKLVVAAHLDTVFPKETNVKAVIKGSRIYAPGISDNGRGLSSVLSLLRALEFAGIQTTGDIIFGATVGEEGLGDLNGVKTLFENNHDIDGFISIEPGDEKRITYLATGSRRYKVTYKGPGGHSFGDFGKPSAIHALGRAITRISDIQTPKEPKTTFNVGIINGGTSINTISANAEMLIDMRSVSSVALSQLEDQVMDILHKAADDENNRWETNEITVEVKLVGDRPAGTQPEDSMIVQAALASATALGFEAILDEPSSTDSNVPISLGIPAVTLGGGGDYGGCHTLNEFYDPTDAFYGVQKIFLTILGLVGVENVSTPLLIKR